MRKHEGKNKGFTLVEFIIVIAIMAVLVGLLAPMYLKYVHNTKVAVDISNADRIAETFNTAMVDHTITDVSKFPDGSAFPECRLNSSWTFDVTMDAEKGVQKIMLNSCEVYPDPRSSSGYYTTHHK